MNRITYYIHSGYARVGQGSNCLKCCPAPSLAPTFLLIKINKFYIVNILLSRQLC